MSDLFTGPVVARIYASTYGTYTNGSSAGKWFDLEEYADRDTFLTAAKKYAVGTLNDYDPELMFLDFEGFPGKWYSEGVAPPEELWDWMELSDNDKKIKALLVDAGINMEPADAAIYEGALKDYAYDLVLDCFGLSAFAERYFDYEAFGEGLRDNGDVVELEPDVWLTNPGDA